MAAALKLMLTVMLKNLGKMILTKHVALWALKFAAKQTDTMVDDNIVRLAEGAYENDPAKVIAAIEAITEELRRTKTEK